MAPTQNFTQPPHPMDTWAKALDALITCAPGSEDEIRAHLATAMRQLHVAGRKTQIPNLQVRLVRKLVAASGIDTDVLIGAEFNVLGFPLDAPLIGEPHRQHPAPRTATEESPESPDSTVNPENASGAGLSSSPHGQPRQPLQELPRGATTPTPSHLPVLPTSQSDRA